LGIITKIDENPDLVFQYENNYKENNRKLDKNYKKILIEACEENWELSAVKIAKEPEVNPK